jgi:N-methylhydantoinase B
MFRFSGGGYGGHPDCDGLTNGSAPISASRTSQVEVLEHLYPVRFDYYAIREQSAGPGERRGGFGVSFGIRLLRGEAVSSILADRGKFAPEGLHGGGPGAMTRVAYQLDGQPYVPEHVTKAEQVPMRADDVAVIDTAGGGGFGDPHRRPRALVARDVERGLISLERAAADYRFEPENAAASDIRPSEAGR